VTRPSARPALHPDVPCEAWLAENVAYALERGRNAHGVPFMAKTTARYTAPVTIPIGILATLPGQRGEQQAPRSGSIDALLRIMGQTGSLPVVDGEPDVPYIEVAHDGSAWCREGNHRIMAAARLGIPALPVDVRYFEGGERQPGPLAPALVLAWQEERGPWDPTHTNATNHHDPGNPSNEVNSMSAAGMTATVLATELAEALQTDAKAGLGDVAAGRFGPAATAYLRTVAAELAKPETSSLNTAASALAEQAGGHWGKHDAHPVQDWQHEVANDDTRLGYWEWVANNLDAAESDALPDAAPAPQPAMR
jgi:hypothetical protein